MPRGKRTVFAMFCSVADCGLRVGTKRLHKQTPAKNRSWKDFKFVKYCSGCMSKQEMKLKEERHSK